METHFVSHTATRCRNYTTFDTFHDLTLGVGDDDERAGDVDGVENPLCSLVSESPVVVKSALTHLCVRNLPRCIIYMPYTR
jgi:hypothetical protein